MRRLLTFAWLVSAWVIWAMGCGDATSKSTSQPQKTASAEPPPEATKPPVEQPDDPTGDTPGDPPADPVTPPTERPVELPLPPLPPPPPDTPNETQQPPPPPPPPPPVPAYHMDGSLHLNEAQFKGTHNSYHVRPAVFTSPAWLFDMPTLTDQLNRDGVRAFELDLHWNGERFQVYHWPDDPNSTCAYVTDCVGELRRWSSAHPRHAPIFVFFDLKYDEGADPITNHLEDLDATLAGTWPRNKVFRPDDFTGGLPSAQAAVAAHGWPTLDAMRGKVVFALMSNDDVARRYAHNDRDLSGRSMHIASGNTGLRYTSIAVFDNALNYMGYIRQAALGGYIVRARADDIPTMGSGFPERFQAALASGANIVVTDYPMPFAVPGYDTTIPGGTPERCNPVTARPGCTSQAIENPALLTSP